MPFKPALGSPAHLTELAVLETFRTVVTDRLLMLLVIANGPFLWRQRFLRNLAGHTVNDDMADQMFAYFLQKYGGTAEEARKELDLELEVMELNRREKRRLADEADDWNATSAGDRVH